MTAVVAQVSRAEPLDPHIQDPDEAPLKAACIDVIVNILQSMADSCQSLLTIRRQPEDVRNDADWFKQKTFKDAVAKAKDLFKEKPKKGLGIHALTPRTADLPGPC